MDIIVGTAGHIDHGKTALVRALTGTDTDRLPEEKQRGITIDLGFAELELGDTRFGFVDVPGHERFVKNMLAGASGIDLVMLIVAADEGVMPQTREHFDICRLLHVKSGFVALTKSDLVDDEMVEMARDEVARFVAGTFLDRAPIVPVSSRTGKGLDDVRNALASVAAQAARREDTHIARLSIDRSFAMKGFGTVVTGTLASGKITDGSELNLLPQGKRLRVRGLQSHGRKVAIAYAGRRTAVNLAGIDHTEVSRGMLLTETGVLKPSQIIDAKVEMLPDAVRGLRTRQRVRIHIGTAEVLARAAIMGGTEILPGESGFAQLRLESPVASVLGERFILRSYSPQETIGGGSVLQPVSERFRRRDAQHLPSFLTALSAAIGDIAQTLIILVERAGSRGISTSEIRTVTGWNAETLAKAVNEVVDSQRILAIGDVFISQDAFRDLKELVLRSLGTLHDADRVALNVPIEKLRALAFRSVRPEIERSVLVKLAQSGNITLASDNVGLAGRASQLSPGEESALASMRDTFANAGLEVPKIDELLKSAADLSKISLGTARKLLQQLLDSREVVRISPEFAVSNVALSALVEKLRTQAEALPDRLIDVPRFKDIAGVSRKYAIPLLEYFDQQRFTVRRGDKRLVM
jgi:selenocysteine-specific elongation factor